MIMRAINPVMLAVWLERTEDVRLLDRWQSIKIEITRVRFGGGLAYYYCSRNDRFSGIGDWPDARTMRTGNIHGYGVCFSTGDVSVLERIWADMHLNLGLAFISDKELLPHEFGEAVMAMEAMDGVQMTNSFEPRFRLLYSDFDGTAIIHGDVSVDMEKVMVEWNDIIDRAIGL